MRGRWRWLGVLCLVGLGCAGPAKTTGVGLSSEAVALNDAGYQYWRQGKWNLAQDKFAQALKLNRLIDRQPGIAANLNNLGAIAQGQGDLKQAENYFREALAIQREQGDTAGISETLNNLGTVYQAQGRLTEAQGVYQEALGYVQIMPPGPLLALTLAVAAFSLAGIPPTGGFTGKFFLFVTAFKAGYLTIVIIAAVNTVISIFYYLNLVRISYSRESEDLQPLYLAFHEKVLCYLFNIIIIYLGLLPFGLIDLFRRAM